MSNFPNRNDKSDPKKSDGAKQPIWDMNGRKVRDARNKKKSDGPTANIEDLTPVFPPNGASNPFEGLSGLYGQNRAVDRATDNLLDQVNHARRLIDHLKSTYLNGDKSKPPDPYAGFAQPNETYSATGAPGTMGPRTTLTGPPNYQYPTAGTQHAGYSGSEYINGYIDSYSQMLGGGSKDHYDDDLVPVVKHGKVTGYNFPKRAEDEHNKVKLSLSRREPPARKDASTYVDEDIIRLTYEHRQRELESTYTDCNEQERQELYKLFGTERLDIDTLIEWGDLYHQRQRTKCGQIDLRQLSYLKKPLTELKSMIGLDKFKDSVIEQILLCLLGLHRNKKDDSQEMYHTVIYGPPGVGKTQLAKILGHIYIAMGLMYKRPVDLTHFDIEDYFETAARSDLIGMYCGHTAVQTQKIIDRCRKAGKVLFIDETYSLGGEKSDKDNFSKECIDTINKNLTEGAGEFICIIAGYPEDIKKCFFSHNKGLERRFNFRYTIDKYSAGEMRDIFMLKLKDCGWDLESPDVVSEDFFNKNKDFFPHYGGDIVTLLQKCKISHARRIFGDPDESLRKLSKADIARAFDLFKTERSDIVEQKRMFNMMYV